MAVFDTMSSGQTLGVKAQRFRGHTSPHRNVKLIYNNYYCCVINYFSSFSNETDLVHWKLVSILHGSFFLCVLGIKKSGTCILAVVVDWGAFLCQINFDQFFFRIFCKTRINSWFRINLMQQFQNYNGGWLQWRWLQQSSSYNDFFSCPIFPLLQTGQNKAVCSIIFPPARIPRPLPFNFYIQLVQIQN
eukprot:TRINITY_DN13585_c0_g1_i5.p2 TRINITY_DN13585_c0_g1~~TRINITY_DN13585_c0_g1_i5.p2  ORF type:complete len:196 (-),score=10.28 TRINITY_DN13585_c0_g1_i5:195-761(-)